MPKLYRPGERMILVVVGANPVVAQAAADLTCDVVHVQPPQVRGLPAACLETAAGTERSWSRTVLSCDFRNPSLFVPFVDEVLRPLAPAAVVSLTEPGLEPAAMAAARLGVAGVAPRVVRRTRDKYVMRCVLERAAPHLNPDFARGDDATAVEALFAGGARVVAKPVDGVGSRGIAVLDRVHDLPPGRRDAGTLLERFVGGREYSVETLSRGGTHTVIGIVQKGTAEGFVEVSHLMPPPDLDAYHRSAIERAVGELLDALGLTDGPSHTEVKVEGDKVVVIETHNRLGGDGIADLVRLTTGTDWRRAALGWVVGEAPRTGVSAARAAATVFLTAEPGRVTGIAPRPLLRHGVITTWEVTVAPGDVVRPLRSSDDRLGMAVVTAQDPADLALAVAELIGTSAITTQPAG